MSIINSIDSETLTASDVVTGTPLLPISQLETLAAEIAWRRPRAERRLVMIEGRRAPRYAIYSK